jgi:hypothetical protein
MQQLKLLDSRALRRVGVDIAARCAGSAWISPDRTNSR